ncbi:MAG: tRNA (adenosine(37)-N6)-threonylcarbamoyltransferase complex dimerization subunit type 1 TsaB, partial [Caulobacteraceae bacterium]
IDARRGRVFWQAFLGGDALTEPAADDAGVAAARIERLGAGPVSVVGPGAAALAAAFKGGAKVAGFAAPDLDALGRLAVRVSASDDLRPLYLRAPVAPP